MIAAGFDFGALAAKAVLMKDGELVSYGIGDVKSNPERVVESVMDKALSEAGLSAGQIDCAASTGWGRRRVSYTDNEVGELPCLAKGAQWLLPSVRTVIDVGGQNSRALSVNDKGKVIDYNLNDKCAAGTGRFFELVAKALEVGLGELAALAYQSKSPAEITSQCCVFAESEVVALLNEGADLADIAAGVHDSTVKRLVAIAGGISIEEDVVMTGGCAKNERLIDGLESLLKTQVIRLSYDPQLVGAIGAALIAEERLRQS
jgi:predicted CoA-substrate-specific enzyme activase